MPNTTNYSFPYPAPTDTPDVPFYMQQLADSVDTSMLAIGNWQAYTPTLSNWTLGNGTLSGSYTQIGKTVLFRVRFVTGSTTVYSGGPNFSLPVDTSFGLTEREPIGEASLFDTSANAHRHWTVALTGIGICAAIDPNGSPAVPTSPWTWAAGDRILLSGAYESV